MKKSLRHIIVYFLPRKLISVIFVFFIVNCTLLTVNSYSQWVQQSVPVTKPITGIKFIDSLKGWACTNSAPQNDTCFILHTTNGGINWTRQFQLSNSSFNALSVLDSMNGYAAGNDFTNGPIIYKTTNGGQNWNSLNISFGTSFTEMFFVNKDSGYVAGSVFVELYTTTNGGLNWTPRTTGITQAPQRLFFLNYTTGFCGANFFLYKTTNAGQSWVLNNNFGEQIQSVYMLNNNTGWLGTIDKIYYTSNSGLNWNATNFPPLFGSITDISFLNNSRGYGGNRSNRILITTNGGAIWGYQKDSSNSYRISILDSLMGWTGDAGISHTTNGGGQITYVGIINISNNVPKSFELFQNYPNPFNSQTNIRFALNRSAYISFNIYDVTGKEQTIWQSGKLLEAGTHELQFEAKDLASGVYFYEIIVTDKSSNTLYKEAKKMVLTK